MTVTIGSALRYLRVHWNGRECDDTECSEMPASALGRRIGSALRCLLEHLGDRECIEIPARKGLVLVVVYPE